MSDKPHRCRGSYRAAVQSLLMLGLFASGLSNKEGYHLLLVEWPQLRGDLERESGPRPPTPSPRPGRGWGCGGGGGTSKHTSMYYIRR